MAATTEAPAAAPKPLLTDRQLDAVRLCANGLTNASIAGELGLSVNTVNDHWREVRRRLGVQSAPHAVAVAMALGILRADQVAVPSSAARIAAPTAPLSSVALTAAPEAAGGPR